MRKYNLIILAGGEDEDWCHQYGCKRKAELPLYGKPMIDLVVDAFHKSSYIDQIIVVGPKDLDQLKSMKHVHKRLNEGKSFIQNLLKAVYYIKSSIYKFSNNHNGYLISFCDAAHLNTKIINATLENMSRHDAGLVLHYVEKETISQSGFPIENRTFLPIGGKKYSGSNIYYVKKARSLLNVVWDIINLRKLRKEPKEFLKYLDCEEGGWPKIEKVVEQHMRTKVKVFVSPFAEMGVDVDKPIDYELAKLHTAKSRKKFLKQNEASSSNLMHSQR